MPPVPRATAVSDSFSHPGPAGGARHLAQARLKFKSPVGAGGPPAAGSQPGLPVGPGRLSRRVTVAGPLVPAGARLLGIRRRGRRPDSESRSP
jgi:hypothetical protein